MKNLRLFAAFTLSASLIFSSCNEEQITTETESTTDATPAEVANDGTQRITCTVQPPSPGDLENGDQVPIVAGKLLSYTVSTEDECAYTPPGKWVNIYGIVYLRYVERAKDGDVSGLIKQTADVAATVLTADQLNRIVDLVVEQTAKEKQALANRDLISRELYKWKSTGGDEDLIMSLTNENGLLLGDLLAKRSELHGEIFNELTDSQRSNLCLGRSNEFNGIDSDILKNVKKQLSKDEGEVLNIHLSKFLAWVTGTVDMNKLVDDGRPAVYFGFANLRIEDRSGDDVSNGLRGEASKLIARILTNDQMAALEDLVTKQTNNLNTHFATRAELATILMNYQNGGNVDTDELTAVSVESELMESKVAVLQAKKMSKIIKSMSDEQLQILYDFKAGNGD